MDAPEETGHDEMRPEYDFGRGEQGKYAASFTEGTNLVILQPDVAEAFPDSRAVKDALRSLLRSDDPKRGRESA